MYKFTSLVLFVSLALALPAQDNVSFKKYGNQTIYEQVSANGLFKHVHAGDSVRIVDPQPGLPAQKSCGQPNAATSTEQLHTVTFHFNPFNTEYQVILVSEDTAISTSATDICQVTLEDGYYDLFCREEYPFSITLIVDRILVNRDIDTTLTLASANIEVNTQVKDQNGNILLPDQWSSGNGMGYLIYFTPGSKYLYAGGTHTGMDITSVKTTPFPPGMRLQLGRESMVVEGDKYSSYVVNYPALNNILSDTLITNEPSDLYHYPVAFNPTPAGSSYNWEWGYGTIANSSLLGYIDTFIPALLWGEDPASATDTIDFYANKAINDSVIAFFSSYIVHSENDPQTDAYLVNSGYMFIDTNDDLIMSIQGNCPPVNGDMRTHPGKAAIVGKGSPFNFSRTVNNANSDFFRIETHYRGMANERRYIDKTFSTYELWQNDDLIQSGTLNTLFLEIYIPSPARYQFVVKNNNYRINGLTGTQKTIHDVDMANTDDPNAPMLLSFRVLQGDSIAETITHGFDASVEFTAADYQYIPYSDYRPYSTPQQAGLFYKVHGSGEWLPIEVTALTDQLDSLAGMPYHADLSALMYTISDSCWIDLKVEIADSAGNLNIQSFVPAFYFNDLTSGTHDADIDAPVIYPNPVSDRLLINKQVSMIALYSIDGRKLSEYTNTQAIDMSQFEKGVYIARIRGNEGKWYVRKVIKG